MGKNKDYLTYSLWLMVMVVVFLLLLGVLPSLTVCGVVPRQVDLLADIRYQPPCNPLPAMEDTMTLPGIIVLDTVDMAPSVSTPPHPVKPREVALKEPCPEGVTCIEDYGITSGYGMNPFYEALDRLSGSAGQYVRIAVFGDSFIEADILTADLREMLQKRYGGRGVGFVPITSITSGYRPTVRHNFEGWHTFSSSTEGFDKTLQGMIGQYFVPNQGAYVELRGQRRYASLLDTCANASIYFVNMDTLRLSAKVNESEYQVFVFGPDSTLRSRTVSGKIGRVKWAVEQCDSAFFYGLTMDGNEGIVVDNFSMRGSSGITLYDLPVPLMRQFNDYRPYDLVVLQFGLNVAGEQGEHYGYYQRGMVKAITHLKECFPTAGFLLVSIADRDYKDDNNNVVTMPGVKNLVPFQRKTAMECGIAFWNLFQAMGGEGSMLRLVESQPAKANYDYTHINFKGGKYLAGLLYEAIINGKQEYDKQRQYELE